MHRAPMRGPQSEHQQYKGQQEDKRLNRHALWLHRFDRHYGLSVISEQWKPTQPTNTNIHSHIAGLNKHQNIPTPPISSLDVYVPRLADVHVGDLYHIPAKYASYMPNRENVYTHVVHAANCPSSQTARTCELPDRWPTRTTANAFQYSENMQMHDGTA